MEIKFKNKAGNKGVLKVNASGYSRGVFYGEGDLMELDGQLYQALRPVTTPNGDGPPQLSANDWMLVKSISVAIKKKGCSVPMKLDAGDDYEPPDSLFGEDDEDEDVDLGEDDDGDEG